VDNTGEGGSTYTKSTNIGFDILSTLVAVERGEETAEAARAHIARMVRGLSFLRRYRGIFPEYIHLNNDGVSADMGGGKIRYSSADSAWLHFAVSVAQAAYEKSDPLLARELGDYVQQADYALFLHDGNRLFRHGVTVSASDEAVEEEWPYSYDNKNSETRLLVVYLTAVGKLPPEVWRNMTYDLVEAGGQTVADGWQLSAFVEMTSNLYFDEARLAPRTLGAAHRNYLAACRKIASDRGHAIYGWAPCYGPDDRYHAEYGLNDPSVVAPYGAALLASTGSREALRNFRKVVEFLPPRSGPLLFPEALDPRTGQVLNPRVLSLDQNLLYQSLARKEVRRLVARAGWSKKARRLIRQMDEWHEGPGKS
jgi:hypothetical protein